MSVNGLVSGLQTDDIISKVMAVARQQQDQLKSEKTDDQSKLAVWQDLNTRVLALKMKADSLATQQGLDKYTVQSSDESVLTASASADAAPGTYFIKVINRAQSHQIAGQAKGITPTPFTSTTADIGTGTLKFTFGSGPNRDTSNDFEVTIDSQNNTLMGARDAINRANKNVQASVVNTGTSINPSYQLLLTSKNSGDASQFTVDAGTTSLDFSTVTQQGKDATLELGDSQNSSAITVHKASNTINDLIPGVTLNIINPDSNNIIKLDVTRDTRSVMTAVQDFITQYNDLSDTISKQYNLDPTTGEGGPLFGDWDLQQLQMTLMNSVTKSVVGADPKYGSMAAVGITMDTQGDLTMDEAQFTKALQAAPDQVSKLFASGMQSDSTYVSYLSSSAQTQSSGTVGWNVNITQAARRAQVTAKTAIQDTGLGNDEYLTISATGTNSKAIQLKQGWSLSQIIEEVNKYSSETGVAALATQADGTTASDSSLNTYLTLRSTRYGSVYDVKAFSSLSYKSGTTSGIGNVEISGAKPDGESDAGTGVGLTGLDVAGTINNESAQGVGQVLTGNSTVSNSQTNGLALMITSDKPMTTTVYFTKGVGTMIRDTLIDITSVTGLVNKAQDSINARMSDIDKEVADWDTRLQAQQDRLYTEFSQMESQLADLQSQGNYLSSQIAAMNGTSNSKK